MPYFITIQNTKIYGMVPYQLEFLVGSRDSATQLDISQTLGHGTKQDQQEEEEQTQGGITEWNGACPGL